MHGVLYPKAKTGLHAIALTQSFRITFIQNKHSCAFHISFNTIGHGLCQPWAWAWSWKTTETQREACAAQNNRKMPQHQSCMPIDHHHYKRMVILLSWYCNGNS